MRTPSCEVEKPISMSGYIKDTVVEKILTIEGYEVVKKTARASGNGARIYVPLDWAGREVVAVLVDDLDAPLKQKRK